MTQAYFNSSNLTEITEAVKNIASKVNGKVQANKLSKKKKLSTGDASQLEIEIIWLSGQIPGLIQQVDALTVVELEDYIKQTSVSKSNKQRLTFLTHRNTSESSPSGVIATYQALKDTTVSKKSSSDINVQKDHVLEVEERNILYVGLPEDYIYNALCLCITVTQEINVIRTTAGNIDRIDNKNTQSQDFAEVLKEKLRHSLVNAEFLGEIVRAFDRNSSEQLLKLYLVVNRYETTFKLDHWKKHTGIYQEPHAEQFLGLLIYETDVALFRLLTYMTNMANPLQIEILNPQQISDVLVSISNYCTNVIEHKNSVVEYCDKGSNVPITNPEYDPIKIKNHPGLMRKLNEHFKYYIDKIIAIGETFKSHIPVTNRQTNFLEIAKWEQILNSNIKHSDVSALILNSYSITFGLNVASSNKKDWMIYGNRPDPIYSAQAISATVLSKRHKDMTKKTSCSDILKQVGIGSFHPLK